MAAFALAASTGASSSSILAVAQTATARLDRMVDPNAFGAKGDGHTDDAAALQAALHSGKRVWLQPGVDYAFGTTLTVPDGGGFAGGGLLTMLTGPGKFDKADYSGEPLTYSGIFAQGKSDVRIEARIQMQANAGTRCCNAIWIRNCTDVRLDVECWGFKEARYGIVEWNSNLRGSVKAYVHDCYVNSNTLLSMQVSGVSVDNNRYDPGSGPINSIGGQFDVRAEDIHFGPAALAAYSYQTDGLSLFGRGSTRHSVRVRARNVYEPLDMWCGHNIVDVVAENCVFGVKMMYGASHNVVRATVDRFMKAGLYLGGGDARGTSYNEITISTNGGGESGGFGDVSAVALEGDAVGVPNNNTVDLTFKGDGVNLDYGVLIAAGSNNSVTVNGSGAAVATAEIGSSAGMGNIIKRRQRGFARTRPPTGLRPRCDNDLQSETVDMPKRTRSSHRQILKAPRHFTMRRRQAKASESDFASSAASL